MQHFVTRPFQKTVGLTLKMNALQSTETSGNAKQMTQHHIPGALYLVGKRRDMLITLWISQCYPQHRTESSTNPIMKTSRFVSQKDVETKTRTAAQLTSISQSRRIALMRGWSPGCLENKFSSRWREDVSSLWHMSSQTSCALAHLSIGSGDKRSEKGVSKNVVSRNLK